MISPFGGFLADPVLALVWTFALVILGTVQEPLEDALRPCAACFEIMLSLLGGAWNCCLCLVVSTQTKVQAFETASFLWQ